MSGMDTSIAYDVVLLPDTDRAVAYRKRAADGGCSLMGVTVAAFGAWVRDLWELYGDGRAFVSRLEREALLRRARIEAEKRLVVGSTVLDAEERSAYVGGKEITLTVREFDLLYKLLSYPRRTFSRAQLMDEFWDGETSASLRAVDVYITRIRDKMSVSDDFKIMTVHGLGYKAVPGA